MFPMRSLNLAILMVLLVCVIFANCFSVPAEYRVKKWYSWNNDIEVAKKWYDWQNMPHTLQQKRQLDQEDFGIAFGKA